MRRSMPGSAKVDFLSRYEYASEEPIAEGGFARIFLCRHHQTNREYVVKVIDFANLEEECGYFKRDPNEVMQQEVDVMNAMKGNSYLVNIEEGFFSPNEDMYIVEEFLKGETLQETILSRPDKKPLSRDEIQVVIYRVLKGLKELHAAGIVHRDMKPDNIFLSEPNNLASAKIGDFGFSRYVCSHEADVSPDVYRTRKQSRAFIPETISSFSEIGVTSEDDRPSPLAPDHSIARHMTANKGTFQYEAPEQTTPQYNEKVDMWAAGVILFSCATLQLPFGTLQEYMFEEEKVMARSKAHDCDFSLITDDLVRDLTEKLLHPDPEQRLSAEDALSHILFNEPGKTATWL